jgi:hypothetical protein
LRINHTGRRKIDKQHAIVALRDEPVGTRRGWYFELQLDLSSYPLPPDARLFVEASRQAVLMRFDLGTINTRLPLSTLQRTLTDFNPDPDGVKFRLKVTQPDGPDAGKLLAEADGIRPDIDNSGVFPLIDLVAANDLGQVPWELQLVPTDSALPLLRINQALGGKDYARNPDAKPLLMYAAAREVFTALIGTATDDLDPDDEHHWATLWSRYATEVLQQPDPQSIDNSPEATKQWIDAAAAAFADKLKLVDSVVQHRQLEQANAQSVEV